MARDEWYQAEINHLIQVVAEINTTAEVETLFDFILTPREINDMAKRLKIREMLQEGKSYLEIRDTLRVSPVIVSRISNRLGYGFRRTSDLGAQRAAGKDTPKRKYHQPVHKYKGSVPLHRMLG